MPLARQYWRQQKGRMHRYYVREQSRWSPVCLARGRRVDGT